MEDLLPATRLQHKSKNSSRRFGATGIASTCENRALEKAVLLGQASLLLLGFICPLNPVMSSCSTFRVIITMYFRVQVLGKGVAGQVSLGSTALRDATYVLVRVLPVLIP